jgi:hypothetical protein
MPAKKVRAEISGDVAAAVLFRSHRACCVCRNLHKAVQIHHVDDNPGNGHPDNLAVLCFDCHRETQIRGGFGRKLDAAQILFYRSDWYSRVERGRSEQSEMLFTPDRAAQPTMTTLFNYESLKETDEENRYSFEAAYPQMASPNASEMNLLIAAFVTDTLQRFRAGAIASASDKKKWLKETPTSVLMWDDLHLSHRIGLCNDDLFSVEFVLTSYHAMAAHPSHNTRTMNFRLRPSPMLLELTDVFRSGSGYVEFVSSYSINELRGQSDPVDWIQKGAGPDQRNFKQFLLVKDGLLIFFDEYQVDCYAAGRREVLIPISAMTTILKEPFGELLSAM